MKKEHIGSGFDDYLRDERLLEGAEATAVKRIEIWAETNDGFAAFRLSGTGLFAVAVISTVAGLWPWGVMMNYRANLEAAPNRSASVNMISFAAGLILLGISFF